MRIHQPVLKLRRLKTQRDAEESADAPLTPEEMPATPEQRLAKAAAQPWLGREDRAAAGFDETLSSGNDDSRGLPEDEGLSLSALPLVDDGIWSKPTPNPEPKPKANPKAEPKAPSKTKAQSRAKAQPV